MFSMLSGILGVWPVGVIAPASVGFAGRRRVCVRENLVLAFGKRSWGYGWLAARQTLCMLCFSWLLVRFCARSWFTMCCRTDHEGRK